MESKHLPTDKLLTPREVASWLDVSVDWVQDHATAKEPRIASVRIGKLLRFKSHPALQWWDRYLAASLSDLTVASFDRKAFLTI